MPRSSRGSAPARRPAPAPARPQVTPPQPQQGRQASTSAVAHPPQAQQSQGPGLFGQMASTAAGVAVGSSIGHAIGGFFGGGSSAPVETSAQDNANATQQYEQAGPCQADITNFRKCMNENGSDLNICGWYLDQLKACQAAASRY